MKRTISLATLSASLVGILGITVASATLAVDAVRVINTNANPVPVNGNVVVSGTANVNVTNANPLPVSVSNPVTIANPVSTVTIGNTSPIPVTVTGGGSAATPTTPYSYRMSVLNDTNSTGPATGQLNVSSIVLTNFDTSPQQVFIFYPIFSGGGCGSGGANIVGGQGPQMTVYVQPQSTLVLPYPTPLVFPSYPQSVPCVAAEVTTLLHGGSVEIDVTGFVD